MNGTDIHFIFEKPQRRNASKKKRSRLVSSCDACRTKKIKCRPSSHREDVCEACHLSRSPCVYLERDRIRAERGIASFTVSPLAGGSSASRHPPSRVSSSSRVISRRAPASKPLLTCHEWSFQPIFTPTSLFQPPFNQSLSRMNSGQLPLFDPYRPNHPNPQLLPHFVTLFFAYGKEKFPFLDSGEVMSCVLTDSLPSLIANCIAAFSARFSDRIDHASESRHLSGEPYINAAKSLLTASMEAPSVESLHALILIAWVEYGSGRANGLWVFGRMAALMTQQLNLGSEESVLLATDIAVRTRLRMVFWSVAWVDIISSSVVGKPTLFRLDTCTTGLPSIEVDVINSFPRVLVDRTLKSLFIIMSMLDDISNGAPPRRQSLPRDEGLKQLRRMITAFKEQLPDSLAFGHQSLRQALSNNYAHSFVQLHLLIHTIIAVVHCPSLFWTCQSEESATDTPKIEVAWSSARSVVDIFLTMRSVDDRAVVASPSYFLALSIAHGAFLVEKAYLERSWQGEPSGILVDSGSSNEIYLNDCRDFQRRLSVFWKSLNVIQINSQAVVLSDGADSRYAAIHNMPNVLQSPSTWPSAAQRSSIDMTATALLFDDTHSDLVSSIVQDSRQLPYPSYRPLVPSVEEPMD